LSDNQQVDRSKITIKKIISGGQTGADRAALDFAIENAIDCGGFVPKERRAEDGRISDKYPNLVETETRNYSERTQLNILNSDATIIFSHGNLTGGSLLTKKLAVKHKKPILHVDFVQFSKEKTINDATGFLASIECEILNIAGTRASGDSEIYQKTKNFLTNLFDQIC
jgi:predicted Rossmann fold nucleotide-binding protein DprA/Smf involved in DNA uptake